MKYSKGSWKQEWLVMISIGDIDESDFKHKFEVLLGRRTCIGLLACA